MCVVTVSHGSRHYFWLLPLSSAGLHVPAVLTPYLNPPHFTGSSAEVVVGFPRNVYRTQIIFQMQTKVFENLTEDGNYK